MRAVMPPADSADRDGATLLLAPLHGQGPRLQHLWADSAYNGKAHEWMQTTWGWTVDRVKHWWTGVRRLGPHDPPFRRRVPASLKPAMLMPGLECRLGDPHQPGAIVLVLLPRDVGRDMVWLEGMIVRRRAGDTPSTGAA
jgi:hypothetical protein